MSRWDRLQELFHRVLDTAAEERSSVLDLECADDPVLRAEVERLVVAHDRAGGFISRPVVSGSVNSLDEDERAQLGHRVGAYKLSRLLGRGGMGAVYLAERDDGTFEQRVAIKLIKRGMDTDLVLARFRAERQILASLDHPNIARLLDGGTTPAGLPYFAMEYIEGQPIDTYAESARLGVEDRLRLFLQVCDAVAYAHSRGVIHRDIKPLNTLVTATGVPKLLDFGIAKVLEDSSDESTTITGLRLLTPDYASPEQVEGRRATVASDVYSLGVVLYELLTGRSPYRVTSRTPQEIAAAVRTTEPERPSTVVTQPAQQAKVRRTIPLASGEAGARQLSRRLRGDLDTIVLTALRKEPARRYPSVADLSEDIRRHLDGRPIDARVDDATYRVGKFVRRQRTALLAAAAVVLAVVSLGTLLARPKADDPTLIATRSLAPRDRIVVADFVDLSGDTVLAAAITEAIRTDLSQSPLIRVLTPRQVRTSLSLMQQSPDVALNDSLARELALREGVKAIVSGSLSHLSGGFTVNVQLLAAQSGEALTSIRETARDSTKLLAAVERASLALRRRIGESLGDIEQMPTLVQATTASLQALRAYSEAQRLVRAGDRSAAIRRFEEATALDSAFAFAYLGLSMAYGTIGDFGRSYGAGDRALAHQERLPFLERSFLAGSRAHAGQDYEGAVRIYNALVDRYPENTSALNNLALAHRDARRFAVAESLFDKASRIDSTIANFLFGRHSAEVLQGKFTEGAATLDTLNRRFPAHPVYLTEVMQDAAAQRDWGRATRTAWAHIEQIGTDTLQLVDPYEALAQIAMARGQLSEAERLWRAHATVARGSGVMSRHLFGVLQRGHLLLRYRGDTAGAVALVDSALDVMPMDRMLPGDRRYDELARFYLAAGQRDRVAAVLVAARANDSTLHRVPRSERQWTHGMLALSQGRVGPAIDSLARASEAHVCTICVLPDLARTLERAGRLREAADTYQRYVTTPWVWSYETDAYELGWTLQRLGDLSDQLGDSARATEARSRLLSLWKDADPGVVQSKAMAPSKSSRN